MTMSSLRDAVDDMTSLDRSEADEGRGSWRPALSRLALDVDRVLRGGSTNHGDEIPGLLPGFNSEADIVRWEQRFVTRSLGMTPQPFLHGVADELAKPTERVLVACLLSGRGRTADIDQKVATELRRRVRSRVVMPAFDRAFQRLRTQATEYADAGEEGDLHNPQRQRYIAMRPSVSELDHWQAYALARLVEGELETKDDVLGWGNVLEQATHGESIELPNHDDERAIPEFVDAIVTTDPLLDAVTGEDERVRVQFGAKFLLPAFNRGVRDLASRSKELANAEHTPMEVTPS